MQRKEKKRIKLSIYSPLFPAFHTHTCVVDIENKLVKYRNPTGMKNLLWDNIRNTQHVQYVFSSFQ